MAEAVGAVFSSQFLVTDCTQSNLNRTSKAHIDASNDEASCVTTAPPQVAQDASKPSQVAADKSHLKHLLAEEIVAEHDVGDVMSHKSIRQRNKAPESLQRTDDDKTADDDRLQCNGSETQGARAARSEGKLSHTERPNNIPLHDTIFWYVFVKVFLFMAMLWRRWSLWRKHVPPFQFPYDQSGGTIQVPLLPLCLKYGVRVKLEEAHLTQFAAKMLEGEEVKIPKIYSAFASQGLSYIVMQKMKGDTLYNVWKQLGLEERKRAIAQLRSAVHRLRNSPDSLRKSVCGLQEGPVFNAVLPRPRGCIAQDWIGHYEDLHQFHYYLRRSSLKSAGATERMSPEEAVRFIQSFMKDEEWCRQSTIFSHGDLSPHNIMIDKKGQVSIIDWETAGWWPAYMEYYMMARYRQDYWTHYKIPLNCFIGNRRKETKMIKSFFSIHQSRC